MKALETERLILRRWKQEDLKPFASLNACKHVCEFFPCTLNESESNDLAKKIMSHFDKHGFGLFAVARKDTKEFIGFTGLNIPDFDADFMPAVEIGWRLAYPHWGKGFATEAATAARDYGFKELKLTEIVSFTAENNLRSRKVMEKIGMCHNISDDFDHPKLPSDSPILRHVLYRITANDLMLI